MATRRRRAPSTVGELLQGSRLSPREVHVDRDTWIRIVGERVSSRAEPGPVQGGVLSVRVASSVWAQELALLSPMIVERLSEYGIHVKSLRFQVSKIERREDLPTRQTYAVGPGEVPGPLRARIERIEDPELRAAITEAAAFSFGRIEAAARRRLAEDEGGASKTAPADRLSRPSGGRKK